MRPSAFDHPDALLMMMMIYEIKLPGLVHRSAGNRIKTIFQSLDLRSGLQSCSSPHRHGRNRLFGNVENGEFSLPHLQVMRHILNRIVIWIFAGAQKRAAAILVANGKPAFRVDMHVAEMEISRVVNPNRRGNGARLRVTRYP